MTNFLENNNDGNFLPYMQWSSQAVQWQKKGENGRQGFTFKQAIFDIENMKLGWIKLQVGGVDKILVPMGENIPNRPTETKIDQQGKTVPAYDKGFSVNVLLGKEFGEDRLYEFSTSQKGSLQAVSALVNQFEAEKASNAGKVPVVEFSGHTNVKMGKGSTNVPNLKITNWVARPAELDEETSNSKPMPQVQAPVGDSEF